MDFSEQFIDRLETLIILMGISYHMGPLKSVVTLKRICLCSDFFFFNTIKHTLCAIVCMHTLPVNSFPEFLEKGSNKIPHHKTLLFGFTE